MSVRQPTHSTCGQTCVAMVVGESVEVIVESMGGRQTHAYELREELFKRGWLMETRSLRLRAERPILPALLLCRFVCGRKLNSHWMWFYGVEIHDPETGGEVFGFADDWAVSQFRVRRMA
jgi:hypothetical protein